MTYDPGAVVLVRFPFTDLSAAKRRPAVILSAPDYTTQYADVVLLALTSQPQTAADALAVRRWKEAGLVKPTWFKRLIATVSASLVDQRLGQLAPDDHAPLVRSILAPEFVD
jgi:mRNA interferase MazF